MAEWETVTGGRARAVAFTDDTPAWVRVADDGTVHFFTDVAGPGDLEATVPAGDLRACLDRLRAQDLIDITCRSLGGEDPGPIYHGN